MRLALGVSNLRYMYSQDVHNNSVCIYKLPTCLQRHTCTIVHSMPAVTEAEMSKKMPGTRKRGGLLEFYMYINPNTLKASVVHTFSYTNNDHQ